MTFGQKSLYIFDISQHCPADCKVELFLLAIFCPNPLQPIEMEHNFFLNLLSFLHKFPKRDLFVIVAKNSLTSVCLIL